MKSKKRPSRLTKKFIKRRNGLVRSVLAQIESMTEDLAKARDPKREIEIRVKLKQLRMTQRSLSLQSDNRKESVPLPRSYLDARAERIEAARRISKRGYVQFVQGGAPGSGNKR
jgi:hypothetical protein